MPLSADAVNVALAACAAIAEHVAGSDRAGAACDRLAKASMPPSDAAMQVVRRGCGWSGAPGTPKRRAATARAFRPGRVPVRRRRMGPRRRRGARVWSDEGGERGGYDRGFDRAAGRDRRYGRGAESGGGYGRGGRGRGGGRGGGGAAAGVGFDRAAGRDRRYGRGAEAAAGTDAEAEAGVEAGAEAGAAAESAAEDVATTLAAAAGGELGRPRGRWVRGRIDVLTY